MLKMKKKETRGRKCLPVEKKIKPIRIGFRGDFIEKNGGSDNLVDLIYKLLNYDKYR